MSALRLARGRPERLEAVRDRLERDRSEPPAVELGRGALRAHVVHDEDAPPRHRDLGDVELRPRVAGRVRDGRSVDEDLLPAELDLLALRGHDARDPRAIAAADLEDHEVAGLELGAHVRLVTEAPDAGLHLR